MSDTAVMDETEERLGTVREEKATGDWDLALQAIDDAVRDPSWPHRLDMNHEIRCLACDEIYPIGELELYAIRRTGEGAGVFPQVRCPHEDCSGAGYGNWQWEPFK